MLFFLTVEEQPLRVRTLYPYHDLSEVRGHDKDGRVSMVLSSFFIRYGKEERTIEKPYPTVP